MNGRRLLIILSAVLLSCSTSPPKPDAVTESKNRAAEFAKAGNDAFTKGLYNNARESFLLALAYNMSVDNEQGVASSYISIGSVELALGNYVDALERFRRAAAIAKRLNDPVLLARTTSKIGEVFLSTGDLENAQTCMKEALSYRHAGIPDDDLAVLLHNMGAVLKKLGRPEAALDHFRQALEINLRLKHYAEAASQYYMIASLYSGNNQFEAAIANVHLALEYDKKAENALGIAKDYLALGLISRRNGKEHDAFNAFKKAYEIYTALLLVYPTLSLDGDITAVLRHLVETGSALGFTDDVNRYKKSLEYYEKKVNR